MQLQPRKTPSQRRSAVTIEAVIESAAQLLNERGIEGFNTNAIAERAGISVGSFYQYFPGKEAVTAALIARRHQQIVACLQDVTRTTEGVDADAMLQQLLAALIRLHVGSRQLDRILELEEQRLSAVPGLSALRTEALQLTRALLLRYVDRARAGESQIECMPRDVVCIVAALLHASLHASDEQNRDLHDRLFRTVKAYLAPLLPDRHSRVASK